MTVTFEDHAVLPVHQANACTGETPLWDPRPGILWWIDIHGQRLLGFAPGTGRRLSFPLPSMPGLVQLRGTGLLIGLEDGLYAFDPETGRGECLLQVEPEDRMKRLNDSQVDAKGRLWFGTMEKTGSGMPVGKLFRLDHGNRLTLIREGIRVPNSLSFSPDGRTLYFSDSRTGVLEAFDYDLETGGIGNGRVFGTYGPGETPDGTCVDAQGDIWIAVIGGGRIERRRADGTLAELHRLPVSRPTMPALGGADGRTLYVTSQRRVHSFEKLLAEPLSGDLIALRVDASAQPARMVTCL